MSKILIFLSGIFLSLSLNGCGEPESSRRVRKAREARVSLTDRFSISQESVKISSGLRTITNFFILRDKKTNREYLLIHSNGSQGVSNTTMELKAAPK